jgi:serine/threonine protein kinase
MPGPSLGERLRAAIQWQITPASRGFIPLSQLDAIITSDSVRDELLRTPALLALYGEHGDALVDNILGLDSQVNQPTRKVRLFATLALLGCTEKIVDFLGEPVVSDGILPISVKTDFAEDTPLVVARDATPLAACFSSWDRSTIDDFEKQQWTVLAPIFSGDYLDLPPEAVYPYTQEKGFEQRRGGTSRIFRVKIPQSHIAVDSKETASSKALSRTGWYALKQIRANDKDSFRRELDAFRRFNSPGTANHPNIVEFLSAWHQDGYFNLVFPWAVSDLSEWWRNNPLPVSGASRKTALWLANQCLGIASGLSAVHRFLSSPDQSAGGYAGHHGDIKPGNILWYPDPEHPEGPGTWKISDFGLSGVGSRTSSQGNGRLGCTPAYRAPEYDIPEHDITVAYDVWSLGCVLLECLTWSLAGLQGIKEMEAQRLATGNASNVKGKGDAAFWEVPKQPTAITSFSSKAQPVVKESVQKWIEGLRESGKAQSPSVGVYVDELSTLLENSMLVPADEQRGSSADIAGELQKMQSRLMECNDASEDVLGQFSLDLGDFTQHDLSGIALQEDNKLAFVSSAMTMPDIHTPFLDDASFQMPPPGPVTMFNTESLSSVPSLIDTSTSATQDWASFSVPEPTFNNFLPSGHATEPAPRMVSPSESVDTSPTCGSKRRHDTIAEKGVHDESTKQRRLEPMGPVHHTMGPPATGKAVTNQSPAATSDRLPASGTLRFACPFHKHDPKTFGIHDPRWRTCVGPGWTTIHRVKEHIDRKHSSQPNTCSRCSSSFPSPYDLDQHHKSTAPCEVNHEQCQRVTEAQRALMRKRPRGRSEAAAWNDIYRIIFGLAESDPVPWPCELRQYFGVFTANRCLFKDHEPSTSQTGESPKSSSSPADSSVTTSSLNEFEEYLTQSIIPNANDETMSKIQGYLDLVKQFRQSSGQVGACPTNETILSSAPSLVSDSYSQMAYSQRSNDTLNEIPTFVSPETLNPSMAGPGLGATIGCGSMPLWEPKQLTTEEEEMSRILFSDFGNQDSSFGW